MIIDILFFHCSFVDMLNITSTRRDILCVDINVDKRCVDHSTSYYTLKFSLATSMQKKKKKLRVRKKWSLELTIPDSPFKVATLQVQSAQVYVTNCIKTWLVYIAMFWLTEYKQPDHILLINFTMFLFK